MRRIALGSLPLLIVLALASPADAAPTQRAVITWSVNTDVDLHAYDTADRHAYYDAKTAIPEAILSEDSLRRGSESFTDQREPSTRSFRYSVCYYEHAKGRRPVEVAMTTVDEAGRPRDETFSLERPGDCREVGGNSLVDGDEDGVADASDNCPADANADQIDTDADGTGDVCDKPAEPTRTATRSPTPTPAPQEVLETAAASPAPVLNETFVAGAVSGTVRVKERNGQFRTLGANESMPLGSTVDATKGTVGLTSAADAAGKTQTALFSQGAFVVTQTRGSKPITQLALAGKLRCPAKGKASTSARRRVRRLWGDGVGRFRTRGRYGAATVKGTKWLTEDRCDGTLVRVRRGVVSVRDYTRKKTVTVRKGKSYLARAKRARRP